MSTNINVVQESCSICGQVHTSTGCNPVHFSESKMTNEKDREEAKRFADLLGSFLVRLSNTPQVIGLDKGTATDLILDRDARIRAEAVKPYQEVVDDFHLLTKELDDALNGDGAAKAPSLCDIVAQMRRIGPLDRIRTEAFKAKEAEIAAILLDPAAVYVNYLRGTINASSIIKSEVAHRLDEAMKAERERCKRKLENLECVNGNETEVRRQDAIDTILSDDQEADVCAWAYINGGYSSGCGFTFQQCAHDSNGVDVCPHCRKPVKEEGRG